MSNDIEVSMFVTLKVGMSIYHIDDKVFGTVVRRNNKDIPLWLKADHLLGNKNQVPVSWGDGVWTTEYKTFEYFCDEPLFIVVKDDEHKLFITLKYGVNNDRT